MSKLTEAARGMDCQVRLPGCNFDTATTILAHYRLAGTCGIGMKPPDLLGAWCCSSCHDLVDGRKPIKYAIVTETEEMRVKLAFAEGILRTLVQLEKRGYFGKKSECSK